MKAKMLAKKTGTFPDRPSGRVTRALKELQVSLESRTNAVRKKMKLLEEASLASHIDKKRDQMAQRLQRSHAELAATLDQVPVLHVRLQQALQAKQEGDLLIRSHGAQIDKLTSELVVSRMELESVRKELSACEKQVDRLRQDLSRTTTEVSKYKEELARANQTNARQKMTIAQLRETAAREIGRVVTVLFTTSQFSRLMPYRIYRNLLRKAGLVERAWYLETYHDVREAKCDPVDHYIRYGAAEGREPTSALARISNREN